MAPSTPAVDGRSTFHLSQKLCLDVSPSFPQEVVRLPRGLHARCMCFHPSKSIIAVALERCLAEYDTLTGAKLSSVQLSDMPVDMKFLPDGNALVVLMQTCSIIAWSTGNWHSRVICPPSEKYLGDKGILDGHLAIGHNVLFFAQHMHTSIRGVLWNAKPQDKKNRLKLKFDNYKRPIVGLTCPPGGRQLFVAYGDATIRVYTIVNGSLAFSISSLASKELKGGSLTGMLSIAPHPITPTAHLLMAAYSNGRVGVWELTGGQQPKRLGQVELQDVSTVVGIGLHCASSAVIVFTYSAAQANYTSYVWHVVSDSRTREVSLMSAKVEPRVLSTVLSSVPELSIGGEPAWQQPSWDPHSQSSVDTPAIRAVHLSPWDGSLALHLWGPQSGLPMKLIGDLPAMEFMAARRLLSIPILQLTSASPLDMGVHGSFAPLHTPIGFWSDGVAGKPLNFPSRLHMLHNGKLQARQLLSGTSQPVPLPALDDNGCPIEAKHVIESPTRKACLIFFSSIEIPAKGAKAAPKLVWRFTCLIHGSSKDSKQWWFLPGATGAFLGSEGSQFAVLEQSMSRAAVYRTEDMEVLCSPQYFIHLSSVLGIFSGPPIASSHDAVASQGDAANGVGGLLELDESMEGPGAGERVIWVSAEEELRMGSFPLQGTGNRTDGMPEEMETPELLAHLPLLPKERVLQVAWQQLNVESVERGISSVGAILTSARLLVVSPQLQVLMQHAPESECPGAPLRILSFLWIGPALVFVNAASQVMLLGWDGSCHLLCSAAEKGPPPILAGALADRLFMLRPQEDGDDFDLCVRVMRLFHPLAIAWATLSSSGLLSGDVKRMRSALHALASRFDSDTSDRELLATLMLHGAGDLAAAIADASSTSLLSSGDKVACHAVAGDWMRATDILLETYQRSIYYPRPPPAGSTMHLHMLALARGALAYGQFATARRLYSTAGEVMDLLVLCFLAGDFQTLKLYSSYGLPESTTDLPMPRSAAAAAEVRQLASALISANEVAFQSGTSGDLQWRLSRQPFQGENESETTHWDLAPPGSLPPMHISEGESTGTVAPLALNHLVPYLGVSATAKLIASSPQRDSRPHGGDEDDGGFNEGSPGQASMAWSPGSADDDSDHSGVDAQEAARQAFQGQMDGFDSSDDESSETSSAAGSGRHKLSIKIKAANAQGSVAQADTQASLKMAAMNLKLVAPGKFSKRQATSVATASSRNSSSSSSPTSSVTSSPSFPANLSQPSSSNTIPSPSSHLQPAAMRPPPASSQQAVPPVSAPAIPSTTSAPVPPPDLVDQSREGAQPTAPPGTHTGGSSLVLFKQGIGEMESGQWAEAIDTLAKAMDRMERESATFGLDQGKKQQRVGLMAQYLAAVQLLQYSREAVTGPGAAASGEAMRAKLLRFAASLKLNDNHRLLLQQDAVRRNLEVGNYGYCLGALEKLIASALEKNASEQYTSQLQAQLEQCDARGGGNASVPRDEDPVVFAEIVATAPDSQEVKFMVQQLYEE